MLVALWLGKRGGGEGTGEMLSGLRGLASEKRGGGLALVRVREGERGVGKRGWWGWYVSLARGAKGLGLGGCFSAVRGRLGLGLG